MPSSTTAPDGYYRHPTIHGDTVVFVCEDDLWSVPASGGTARRLTAGPGRITFPAFSPDGSMIAFTGQHDGDTEAHVLPASGGVPRRLSHFGSTTQVVGWKPDGKAVLCATDWRQFRMGFAHLHEVSLRGGPSRALRVGPARAIAHQPGGKGVVIGRNSGDPARWKRYRGGTAGTLWVDREGKGSFKLLIRLDGNLASPMWLGSRLYFLSDHEGHGNLYSCTATGRGLKRHTNHEDFYVRYPSTDGKRIVYHAGADLFVYDPRTGVARKLEIAIGNPRAEAARRFVPVAKHLEGFALHPAGHSVATTARGGAFAMGCWDGAAMRFGEPSKERHRLATYTADGKHLLTVADTGGEECLVLHPVSGRGRRKKIPGDLGRVLDLEVAPAGRTRVACTNHRQELLVVDLQTKKIKRIDRSEHERIDGIAWSPDGRFLAYGFATSLAHAHIRVLDTSTGKTRQVTRPEFRDGRPSFDVDGAWLAFVSYRVFDPVYDGLYFDLGFPRGARPCVVLLKQDAASPFDAAQRAPRGPQGAKATAQAGKPKVKDGSVKVDIDFAGIEDRVVALPVPEGRYVDVKAAKGRLFFASLPIEGSLGISWVGEGVPSAKAKLEAWTFEKDKAETVYAAITDFRVAADGTTLGVRVGNRIRVLPAAVKSEALPKGHGMGRETGWVDLGRIPLEVHPIQEWKQMFREAWRLQRDQFWTPDMGGIDWEGVHDAYLPLVDRVACRSDFSDLLWEMQGELGTSHCYELGGDYRPLPAWRQGFLGADIGWRKKSEAWVVERIPHGDSWDAKQCSPLAAPGVGVREGDEILAVDGEKVHRKRSPARCLAGRAGKVVSLTVRTGSKKARSVVVTTLGSEVPLRYRDWVETNRASVHDATKGRVGYLHIPDMAPNGFAEFHRYYASEVERDGLIVDVRFNGGGHVSQLLLQKLLRKRVGYGNSRWSPPESYPAHAPMGSIVALTNEYAGSDGDIFSHAFKSYGLGPLIGTRTWGGVVGIWPRHALVDGTITTQPEFSHWFFRGGYGVENYGTDPDIEVDIRPQDHAAGRDPQLKRALIEITAMLKREQPGTPDFPKPPSLVPPSLPKSE